MLCDVIMTDGQCKKYVNTVLGVVITFVIAQPLVTLLGNFSAFDDTQVTLQQQYLDYTQESYLQYRVDALKLTLAQNALDVLSVIADGDDVTVVLANCDISVVQAVKQIAKSYFDGEITVLEDK